MVDISDSGYKDTGSNMNVFLDANILIADPWLRSQKIRLLIDYVKKTSSKILIHEIVLLEVRAHFKRTLSNAVINLETALRQAQKHGMLGIPEIHREEAIQKTMESWWNNFVKVLDKKVTELLPLDNSLLPEAIHRSVERIPPCSDTGEEIRDAIIWLSLLTHCKTRYPISEVAFISANTHEFGDTDKISLHPKLLGDVKQFDVKLSYYTSLDIFLKSQAEPIAHITMEWVQARLDMSKAETLIREQLVQVKNERFKIAREVYRKEYKPVGNPDITQTDVELSEVGVWEFNDHHIELILTFHVYVEADIVCQWVNPQLSYFDYEEDIETDFKERQILACFMELGFVISARVVGDTISLMENEEIFRLY